MSTEIINDAIQNTIRAFRGCAEDDPRVERILSNIDNEFSNIELVTLDSSLPANVRKNISILYETLDKSVIILRYIESFQRYIKVYRKTDIKSIISCMNELETNFHTIVTNIEYINQHIKS